MYRFPSDHTQSLTCVLACYICMYVCMYVCYAYMLHEFLLCMPAQQIAHKTAVLDNNKGFKVNHNKPLIGLSRVLLLV